MHFEPFGDRVLIRPDVRPSGEQVLPSGLIKPDIGDHVEMTTGTIQGFGPDVPTTLRRGDRVLYSPYTGMKMVLEGQVYVLLNSMEIMGRLTKEAVAKVS